MKSLIVVTASFAIALLAGACSGDAPATDETTAALLAQPVGDGVSTPIAADPSLAEADVAPVSVAPLGFNRGDTTALVKVVEMSDFGCGYCKRFHDETFPMIRDEFIATGKVEWKFIPYITGMFENSLAVTEAAECVMEQSPDAYERIAARLWDEQRAWKDSSEPDSGVRGWVAELGVDMAEYDACLTEDRRLNRIASATTLARQIGVRGTPTFVVLGYPPLQGALPSEFFHEILTAVHAEETRKRAEGASGETGN